VVVWTLNAHKLTTPIFDLARRMSPSVDLSYFSSDEHFFFFSPSDSV